jgi:phosphate transport system substrate-binding protein
VSQLCDSGVTWPAYGAQRMTKMPRVLVVGLAAAAALAGCSKRKAEGTSIKIDGSSTVFPISQAVGEEFQKASEGSRVTVGSSGTGGGFKKLCRGEIDIAGASRPIKPTEVEACAAAKIDWIELPVAYDGIAVVVNPKNTWVDQLSVPELKKMWEAEAERKITNWSQVRDGFPDRPLRLFGAGVDSGTYDYFTAAVNGKEHSSRGDYTSSEDDGVLVKGVEMDQDALGFFGFAYYAQNKDVLKIVPIDDGKAENGVGAIIPSVESIANSTYQPLSRPIFIYVSRKAVDRPEVAKFVDYFLRNAKTLSAQVGYVALPERAYELVQKRFEAKKTGSVFAGKGSTIGVTVEQLLASEGG